MAVIIDKDEYFQMGVIVSHNMCISDLGKFESTFLSKTKNTNFSGSILEEWTHAEKKLTHLERIERLSEGSPDWLSFDCIKNDVIFAEIHVMLKTLEFHVFDVYCSWGALNKGNPQVYEIMKFLKDVINITKTEKLFVFPVGPYWYAKLIDELAKESLNMDALISCVKEKIRLGVIPKETLVGKQEFKVFLEKIALKIEMQPGGDWDRIFLLKSEDILE